MIISIIIGMACAIICVYFAQRTFPNKDHAFWRVGLVIAAIIYVAFALIGRNNAYLPIEIGGVFFYGLFAFLSKKHSLYWLAIGWLFHIGWDMFLHAGPNTPFVPLGYPEACIGFDIMIAAYICWLIPKRKKLVRQ